MRGGERSDFGGRAAAHEVQQCCSPVVSVGGCLDNVSQREIKQAFERIGRVASIRIHRGGNQTCAYVAYANSDDARSAICELDGASALGTILAVRSAPTLGGQRRPAGDFRSAQWESRREHTAVTSDGQSRSKNGERGQHPFGFRPDDAERSRQSDAVRNGNSRLVDEPCKRHYDDSSRKRRRSPSERSRHSRQAERMDRGLGDKRSDPASTSRSPSWTSSLKLVSRAESRKTVVREATGQVRINLWQLPLVMTSAELVAMASKFGHIVSHELWQEGKHMCANVEYQTREMARRAFEKLHDSHIDHWDKRVKALLCD